MAQQAKAESCSRKRPNPFPPLHHNRVAMVKRAQKRRMRLTLSELREAVRASRQNSLDNESLKPKKTLDQHFSELNL